MTEKSPPPADSPSLRDESRLTGWADDLKTPQDPRAASELVAKALEKGQPMTFQGARTGLTGAGVPRGGLLINLSQLDKVQALRPGQGQGQGEADRDSGFELKVQCGYKLADLKRDLTFRRLNLNGPALDRDLLAEFRARELFWPPDPGETSATFGGLAATNAAGPNRAKFGATGAHVKGLAVILKDGLERELERGQFVFGPRGLPLPFGGFLDAEPGHLGLPPGADLLDLLIGGQGMYGYVSGLWLGLKKAPKSVWALVFFLDDEKKAAHLIEKTLADDLAALVSLDFLDAASLGVIAELGKSAKKLSQIPQTPAGAKAAVMVELMAEGEYLIEKDSGKILENCQEVGGDPDASWALVGSEAEKARIFRHAVPEGLGGKIDAIRAGGYLATKTAGDFTRPDLSFGQALFECRRDLKEAALEAAIFGHAHSSHLHVNFLPTDGAQTKRALELMGHWLELAKMAGGELFFEQGVGKLKKELFLAHERPQRILALKKVKKALDPQGLFNPHNLFD